MPTKTKAAREAAQKAALRRIRDIDRGAELGRVEGIKSAFGITPEMLSSYSRDLIATWGPLNWLDFLETHGLLP